MKPLTLLGCLLSVGLLTACTPKAVQKHIDHTTVNLNLGRFDAAAVEITAPSVTPPPSIVTAPANTNASPVNPVASVPTAPTNPPTPQPVATAAAPAVPVNNNPQAALNSSDSSQQATGFSKDLQGRLVVLEDGQTKSFDASTLQGVKYWAVYYSASWCPDCSTFTPDLVGFYKAFKPDHPNFELIFVCHDKTEEAMLNYMKTDRMTWPALRFSGVWNQKPQALKYIAKGIPNLVLVDENGKVLSSTYNGTENLGPEKVMDDIKKLVPAPTLWISSSEVSSNLVLLDINSLGGQDMCPA